MGSTPGNLFKSFLLYLIFQGSTLNDEVFEYSLEEHEDDAVVVYSNSSRPNTSSTNYSEKSKSKKRRKNNAWTAS